MSFLVRQFPKLSAKEQRLLLGRLAKDDVAEHVGDSRRLRVMVGVLRELDASERAVLRRNLDDNAPQPAPTRPKASLSRASALMCPGCDVPLSRVESDGTPVGTCMTCFGRFVTHDEFRGMATGTTRHLAELKPKDLTTGDADFRCPSCDGAFVQVTHNNVEFDLCSRCGGVWFDVAEEERIFTDPGRAS